MQEYSPPSERLSLTPLIDIAFLVLIFFMALPLKRLDGKLAAHLPTKNGIEPTFAEQRYVVPIRVRKNSFQVGDRRLASAWDLAPTLKLLGKDSTYSIRGDADVGWNRIVAVVDVLSSLKYQHIEFFGTQDPPRRVRRSIPLPKPRRRDKR
jgi:biopolymer transport protein ExbD